MRGSFVMRPASGIVHSLRSANRAQSHVVGVVLLLGLTAIAIGGLTVSIGAIIQDQTSQADATSVAADFDSALRPVETTGTRRESVSFSEGSISTERRDLRILNGSGVVRAVAVDALVYESGDRRVAFVAGAIVRGQPGTAWIEHNPPVTSGPEVLIVGAPTLNGTGAVSGTGGLSPTLATNVSHSRKSLGGDDYRVAIETETPGAFDQFVAEQNATSTVRDLDGDGVSSVVIDYTGARRGYLVVHDMRLEVTHG